MPVTLAVASRRPICAVLSIAIYAVVFQVLQRRTPETCMQHLTAPHSKRISRGKMHIPCGGRPTLAMLSCWNTGECLAATRSCIRRMNLEAVLCCFETSSA